MDNHNLEIPVHIENTKACKRYAGVTITGVSVEESPDWLKTRMRSIGQNPINNVVDIPTSYCMKWDNHCMPLMRTWWRAVPSM